MKKIIMLVPLMVLFLMSSVYADGVSVKVPASQMGPEASINYAGVKAKIVTSANLTFVSSNSCVLYGIMVSSVGIEGAAGSYIVSYDTDTVSYTTGMQTLSAFDLKASTSSQFMTLPFPVRFANGLIMKLTRGTSAGTLADPVSYTVLYMDTDTK